MVVTKPMQIFEIGCSGVREAPTACMHPKWAFPVVPKTVTADLRAVDDLVFRNFILDFILLFFNDLAVGLACDLDGERRAKSEESPPHAQAPVQAPVKKKSHFGTRGPLLLSTMNLFSFSRLRYATSTSSSITSFILNISLLSPFNIFVRESWRRCRMGWYLLLFWGASFRHWKCPTFLHIPLVYHTWPPVSQMTISYPVFYWRDTVWYPAGSSRIGRGEAVSKYGNYLLDITYRIPSLRDRITNLSRRKPF